LRRSWEQQGDLASGRGAKLKKDAEGTAVQLRLCGIGHVEFGDEVSPAKEFAPESSLALRDREIRETQDPFVAIAPRAPIRSRTPASSTSMLRLPEPVGC
jgi:hypothetical protein